METISCDVLVIGSEAGGLSAAITSTAFWLPGHRDRKADRVRRYHRAIRRLALGSR
jgi:hypothetical protein